MNRAEAIKAVKTLEDVVKRAPNSGEAVAARDRASHLRAKFKLSDSDVTNSDDDGYGRFNYYMTINATLNGIRATLDHTKRQFDTLNVRDRADAAARLYKQLHEIIDLNDYPPSLKRWRNEAIKARYEVEVQNYLDEWVSEDKPELDNLHSRAVAHDWAVDRISNSHLRRDSIEVAVGVSHKVLWDRYLKARNNQERMTSTPKEGTA